MFLIHPKLLRCLICSASIVLLIVLNSHSVKNTKTDELYINAFSKEWNLNKDTKSIHADFDSEIQFLRTINNSVISNLQHQEIPNRYFGDMAFYFKNRKGFCYDRAVLMEKILSYYGFPFRHVFVYFSKDKQQTPSFFEFFTKGMPSHALLEVETKKGWIVMGTNSSWIGLSVQGQVLNLAALKKRIKTSSLQLKYNPSSPEVFWKDKGENFGFIYGIYSRHGGLFTQPQETIFSSFFSFSFLPDYNLSMLFSNF